MQRREFITLLAGALGAEDDALGRRLNSQMLSGQTGQE